MRSLKTVLLIFCVSFLLSAAATTQAAGLLAIQHRLVDVAGTDVTLEITVTNTGDTGLNNITIVQMGPFAQDVNRENPLIVPNLSAGASSISSWTISTAYPVPPHMVLEDLVSPMQLIVSADDESGEAVYPALRVQSIN